MEKIFQECSQDAVVKKINDVLANWSKKNKQFDADYCFIF